MARELERLVLRIEADTKRLRSELRLAEGAARQTGTRMSRAFARASRGLAGLTRKIGSTRTAFVALAGATALGFAIKRSIDFTEQIGKQADAIGISTATLQRYRFAAQLSGISTEALDKGLKNFTKAIGEARVGTGTMITILRKANPALLEQLLATNSVEEALLLYNDAIADAGNATDRAALSSAGFARAGKDMVILTRDGKDAFRALLAAADRLGLVIEDRLIRNSEKASDQLLILAQVIRVNFTRGLLSGFLEDFTDFAALVEDPKFAAGIRDLGDAVEDFVSFVITNHDAIIIGGAALAGLFTGAVFGPIGALVGSLGAGTAAFVLLGDEIITVAEATERLEKALVKLALLNAKLESGGDVFDLNQLVRLKDEIAELEEVIAETSRRQRAALQPSRAAAGGGLVVEIGPTAEQQARAVALFEATRTAAERFAAEQEKLNALLAAGALTQDTFNRAVAQASAEYVKAEEAAGKLARANLETADSFDDLAAAGEGAMDDLIDAVHGFGREFSRTMAEALVTGDITFKRLGQSFLVNFAELVIQKQITSPLFRIFEGFLDSLSSGGGVTFQSGGAGGEFGGTPFAHGAVVAHGAVERFARGGVVNRPALFRLAHGAGLMSEAGAEAILPLARLPGGDLGVRAAGAGATVSVTIVNNTGAPVETRESRSGNQGRDIEIVIGRIVSGDIRSGGETFKAVRETFNLTPSTALR